MTSITQAMSMTTPQKKVVACLEVEEGATDGGADERANSREAETHAYARADLAEIWGERDEGARRQ